jgi:hypothetical protein
MSRHPGDLTRQDFSCFGNKFSEKFHITKVDGLPIDIDSAAGRSAIHATGTTGFFNDH